MNTALLYFYQYSDFSEVTDYLSHLFDLERCFKLVQVDLFVVSGDALKLFGHPLQPAGVLVQTHGDLIRC